MIKKAHRPAQRHLLDRERAMSGRPCRLPVVGTETKDAKLHVTVELARPSWQRLLGADRTCRRTFALDEYGQEVYAQCHGRMTVAEIAESFAKRHHLSPAEAELAVASFLRTLMTKGLVGIGVKMDGR